MHVLTHAGVAIPSVDKYHPALKEHIPTIKEMGEAAEARNGLTWVILWTAPMHGWPALTLWSPNTRFAGHARA